MAEWLGGMSPSADCVGVVLVLGWRFRFLVVVIIRAGAVT